MNNSRHREGDHAYAYAKHRHISLAEPWNSKWWVIALILTFLYGCAALIPVSIGGLFIAKSIHENTHPPQLKPRDPCKYCYKGMTCRKECGLP